jgi:NDP-sugar pyrophosphorylase family protein
MQAGAVLQTMPWTGPYFDVGSARSYLDANLAWLASRGQSSWVGPGAAVSPGVALDRVIIGDGATIGGKGMLDRCVVWPGAAVEAPLADAVVAPGHVVFVPSC